MYPNPVRPSGALRVPRSTPFRGLLSRVPGCLLLLGGTAATAAVGSAQESCRRLLTPEGVPVGEVCHAVRGDSLVLEYRASDGWTFLETHVAVAADREALPHGSSGVLRLGGFPFGGRLEGGAGRVRHAIALVPFAASAGARVAVAAQASTAPAAGEEQGAWAEGELYSAGGHPGTFFEVVLPAGVVRTEPGGPAAPPAPSPGRGDDSGLPPAPGRAGSGTTDTLRGGGARDVLFGEGGPDLVEGGGGPDWLDGGDDDDVLRGGAGDDVIEGGAGTNVLEGGAGADQLRGGTGRDWLFGDEGADVLTGGGGDDVLQGGSEADHLLGGPGDDIADGEAGDDILVGGDGDDVLDGGDGSDRLHGGPGADDLDGGDEDDALFGDDGDDTLEGADGDDGLEGGGGDDVIHGGDGRNTISGGAGQDALGGGDDDDVVRGGAGNDLIAGGLGDDLLWGEQGHDTILGQGGADILRGDLGDDVLRGGAGADVLDGGVADDHLLAGSGTDVVRGGEGDDVVVLRAGDVDADGRESIDGGAGDDLLVLHGFPEARAPAEAEGAAEGAPTPPSETVILDPWTGGVYSISGPWRVEHRTTIPPGLLGQTLVLGAREDGVVSLRVGDSVVAIPGMGVRELAVTAPAGAATSLAADGPFAIAATVGIPGIGQATAAALHVLDELVLPVRVRRGTDDALGVALAASGTRTLVSFILGTAEGVEVATAERTLDPHGAVAVRLDDLFPGLDAFAGSLEVRGESLTAVGVRRSGGTTVALPPLPMDPQAPGRTQVFPDAVGGPADTTVLMLYNPLFRQMGDARTTRGTVLFLDEGGRPTAVEADDTLRTGFAFELRGRAAAFHRLVRPSGAGPVTARIQVLEREAHASLERRGPGGAWAANAALPVRRFVTAARAGSAPSRITISAMDGPVRLRLRLRDADGRDVAEGSRALEIPEGGSVAGSLEDLFPGAVVAGAEWATVEGRAAEGSVAVTVVEATPGGAARPLPIAPLPPR